MYLWIDKSDQISQAEIWLEIRATDLKATQKLFKEKKVIQCNQMEKLPDGFKGFWIMNPANIVHLISCD
jgi:hypothetical protein